MIAPALSVPKWLADQPRAGQDQAPSSAKARAREPDFVAVLWVTNVIRLVAAVLALALVRPFGKRWRRRWSSELVQDLLMALGAIDRGGLDDTAVYGHVLLREPWWILGACLFAPAAWRTHQTERVAARS